MLFFVNFKSCYPVALGDITRTGLPARALLLDTSDILKHFSDVSSITETHRPSKTFSEPVSVCYKEMELHR